MEVSRQPEEQVIPLEELEQLKQNGYYGMLFGAVVLGSMVVASVYSGGFPIALGASCGVILGWIIVRRKRMLNFFGLGFLSYSDRPTSPQKALLLKRCSEVSPPSLFTVAAPFLIAVAVIQVMVIATKGSLTPAHPSFISVADYIGGSFVTALLGALSASFLYWASIFRRAYYLLIREHIHLVAK